PAPPAGGAAVLGERRLGVQRHERGPLERPDVGQHVGQEEARIPGTAQVLAGGVTPAPGSLGLNLNVVAVILQYS
ncbi:MAG: hypothetical protein M3Z75_12405, partial [Actinomycetota bacterium]|nr:hypothetical protein [Actinomycetota bacterium]